MEYNIPIPEQSQIAFEAQKNRQFQNAGLIFERFAPDTKDDSKVKEKGLQAVLNAFEKADKKLFQEWNTRWGNVIRTAGADPFTLKTDWRLIVGLGKKSSLEVGFTFNRYGYPYLPGSSLKGLARTYGLLEIALGIEAIVKNKAEKEPLSKLDVILSLDNPQKYEEEIKTYQPNTGSLQMVEAFRLIFGTTDTAGKVVFFDAIPSEFPKLELDIMNPHYPDYYKDMGSNEPKVYPTNWQSPIPVKFLTLAPKSNFRFAIGWRNSAHDKEKNGSKWNGWFKGEQIKQETEQSTPRLIKLARRWLQGGLLELGAGGKTSAGYGYFIE